MSRSLPPVESKEAHEFTAQIHGLGRACLVAILGGLLIGTIGAAFRAGLNWLEAWHREMVNWAHAWPWAGWLFPVLLGAVGAGLARLLVRPQPLASGSGVQHVEAVMRGEAQPISLLVVPIKFFGGFLGIGSGLALGREGPTIQMGATIGADLARRFRCTKHAMRDLQAALGGAGLAVAFNAPMGGAMFVFEEVAHAFRLRLTIVTLLGTGTAIGVSWVFLGSAPDFNVAAFPADESWKYGLYVAFGAGLGVLGVLYNKLTIFGLDALAKLRNWPLEARAALVGAIVGGISWFFPDLVGGGDATAQLVLNGGVPLATLLLIFVMRSFLGPLSYSAGTPGGLFSPLLLLGAAMGAIFVALFNAVAPADQALSAVAFAVVGMTAFFTGVVRAPFTGIILIMEMTGTTTLLVPMLAAAFGSVLSSSLLRGEPIYDTLRKRMLLTLNR